MFQKINDKINLSFDTEVTKGTDDIMTSLKEKAKGHKWFSFLIPGQIDYKEFKFLDNEIEIRRMPNTFWPFRAFGKIKFTFEQTSPTKTKIKCEVMVGNNLVPLLLTIQTVILLLWSTLWIVLTRHADFLQRFGPPIAVLTVFNGISLLKIRIDRQSLIDYSDTIVKLIKE